MSVIRRLVDGERRSAGGYLPPGAIPPNSYGGAGNDGPVVSEAQALRQIDVYASVSLLCDAVSMLPLDGFRRMSEGAPPSPHTPSLLAAPDPKMDRATWVSQVVASLALRGNAYGQYLGFDSAGWPLGIRTIHPDYVTPKWNADHTDIELALPNGKTLQRGEFFHIPLMTLPGSPLGLSPLECARRGIRLAIQTEQFGDRWFTDGAAPSSVLESDTPVDDDEARRTIARWVASHGGRRRPALLSGGLKWRPITISPNESQFLETRKLNTTQIARVWRIPPHMIGQVEKSTSWGSGIEEQGIGFVVFTLGPYLQRIESALTRCLPRPQYAKFNVNALLRGNTKDRYLSYAIGRQWGWLSVNDIRDLEDLPPVDGGDTYLQPLNMIDAEKALQVLLDKTAPPQGGNG